MGWLVFCISSCSEGCIIFIVDECGLLDGVGVLFWLLCGFGLFVEEGDFDFVLIVLCLVWVKCMSVFGERSVGGLWLMFYIVVLV